jgi:hypothetical protein
MLRERVKNDAVAYRRPKQALARRLQLGGCRTTSRRRPRNTVHDFLPLSRVGDRLLNIVGAECALRELGSHLLLEGQRSSRHQQRVHEVRNVRLFEDIVTPLRLRLEVLRAPKDLVELRTLRSAMRRCGRSTCSALRKPARLDRRRVAGESTRSGKLRDVVRQRLGAPSRAAAAPAGGRRRWRVRCRRGGDPWMSRRRTVDVDHALT